MANDAGFGGDSSASSEFVGDAHLPDSNQLISGFLLFYSFQANYRSHYFSFLLDCSAGSVLDSETAGSASDPVVIDSAPFSTNRV